MTDVPITPDMPIASDPGRRGRRGIGLTTVRHLGQGIGAVGVKELRGRMRGRRAFVILTIYLVLLAGFAWMVELIMERSFSSGFGGSAGTASASIGQGVFAALLMLETLQVAFLAPASTAGSISQEREKQTLELLVVTPISSLAMVIGKLFSALIYVWLLIAASIPLTAIVFVFGGVAPDDVLRGYIVLIVTALGFGAIGLLASSLVKRTQAAIAISVFAVLFLSIGTLFLLVFWQAMGSSDDGRGVGPITRSPPQALAYLNPFIAQVDVLCGTEGSFGAWCSLESGLIPESNSGVIFQTGPEPAPAIPLPAPVDLGQGGVVVGSDGSTIDTTGLSPDDIQALRRKIAIANGGGIAVQPNGGQLVAPADVVPFGVNRDALWTKSVIAWFILAVIFLLLSSQFVSPTRRWRLRRRRTRSVEGEA
jgi:ABC-type transport system involved in multi-copper enzyme maturation permease subunit